MKRRTIAVAAAIGLTVSGGGVAYGSFADEFEADLSGRREVPVRITNAEGEIELELSEKGGKLHYELEVDDVRNLWMAHLHLGAKGTNGPIVVWLLPAQPPSPASATPGVTDGEIAEGDITAADLLGPLAGKSLKDLLDAIAAGNIYANVHTNDFVDPPNTGPGDFPGGEIRGQVHAEH